ncbi:CheR family methyltransferase [Alcaligenes sp. WGS1538]|uniref:CheR family methyltransferase n=1 Tax=Alcaligenes sp. WGS1538 TaxID=3366811 RepID=UPI00372D321D
MSTPVEPFVYTLPVIPQASRADCERASRLLKSHAGIILGTHKEDMVARTLGMRTQKAGLTEVRQYLDFLERDSHCPQWQDFVNAFTINHTAFFREQHHFDILGKFVSKRPKPLDIWCSAASTGEEAYSIAMTVREHCASPDTGVSILATDIDSDALDKARQGVYTLERIEPVPEAWLPRYFQRGVGARKGLARVKPALRQMVEFDEFNLVGSAWPANKSFDVIFCRNTMIYFDREDQTRILERFAAVIKPGGLLFVGHSENFSYLTKAFRLLGQTVYVRD